MGAERALAHLTAATRRHGKETWQQLDAYHLGQGQDGLLRWPAWCYLPIAAGVAAATRGQPTEHLPLSERAAISHEATILTGLAAWRMTKGVYEFDPELLEALWGTSLKGNLPARALQSLPEWCVYLSVPARDTPVGTLHGAFCWLEYDVNTHQAELRFLLDVGTPAELVPVVLHLSGTLEEGVEAAVAQSLLELQTTMPGPRFDELTSTVREMIAPLVNLLLYLASEEPDVTGNGRPGNPQVKRVKRGPRLFPADGIRAWEVGVRVGAAIRRGQEQTPAGPGGGQGGRSRPRPHIRAAHWHLYWTGPRSGEQTPVVRWIPPTLVAADTAGDELPAVTRRVKAPGELPD